MTPVIDRCIELHKNEQTKNQNLGEHVSVEKIQTSVVRTGILLNGFTKIKQNTYFQ